MTKKGQITVFIIIGIIIVVLIGIALYFFRTGEIGRFEAARPSLEELPQEVAPLREQVHSAMRQVAVDALRRIGQSGGYVDTTFLASNYYNPTEGDSVSLFPDGDPTAYWYYMKSRNSCESDCEFTSKRPALYRQQGGINIESQLDNYVSENLPLTVNFESAVPNCDVTVLDSPVVTSTISENDVFFVAKWQLRANCGGATYTVDEFYVPLDVNLKEIYDVATEITNMQADNQMLEQATKNIIDLFSQVNSKKLPPTRDLEIGIFDPGEMWIKYDVTQNLKSTLASYIPFMQAFGTRNYDYVVSPTDARDSELYENIYNRHFLVPLEGFHPDLEVRFAYYDTWEPYFDLNCNGQICRADSAQVMIPPLFMTINRYNFPYDLSYPVQVELRNPYALNGEGYVFNIMLEQNLRNTEPAVLGQPFNLTLPAREPSLFCDPGQKTAGPITLTVKNGQTGQPIQDANVAYLCGEDICSIGKTGADGKLIEKYPLCLGGNLRVVKQGMPSANLQLDLVDETEYNFTVNLQPVRNLNASIRNYLFTKQSKRGQWSVESGPPVRPEDYQQSIITLTKETLANEEPVVVAAIIEGDGSANLELVPGKYHVTITSLLRTNITIPVDERCTKGKKIGGIIKVSDEKCYKVPTEPIIFDDTKPFPYSMTQYEWEVTNSMLAGKNRIQFRQFAIAIDKVPQNQRVVEDLTQIEKVQLFTEASKNRILPVLT